MLQPQPSRVHHALPSSRCNLRGCGGILSGVSVSCAELLWLCCSLLCSCCGLCGCACVLSKVFHVTATAFQSTPYTTQLVLWFVRLSMRFKQGVPCYSHGLPKSNMQCSAFVAFCRISIALLAECSRTNCAILVAIYCVVAVFHVLYVICSYF